jgi:hypothetical protein
MNLQFRVTFNVQFNSQRSTSSFERPNGQRLMCPGRHTLQSVGYRNRPAVCPRAEIRCRKEVRLLRRGRGWRRGCFHAGLGVVFLLINVLAGLLQVLVQVFALSGSEFAIGFIGSFFRPDGLLFLAELGGFRFSEFPRAYSLGDAALLGVLPRVHQGILRTRPGRTRSKVAIMPFAMDIAADLIGVLMQIPAFGWGEFTVGFVGAFLGPESSLFALEFPGFFLG